jgi:hypothetical protein
MNPRTKPPGTTDADFIRPSEIPFLSRQPTHDRRVPLLSHLRSDGRFDAYVIWGNDELMVVQPNDLVIGRYVSSSAATPTDLESPLYTTVLKHFSSSYVLERLKEVLDDFDNALASIHKYFVALQYANTHDDFADTAMVKSELEYAFANHRSMHDQLNKLISAARRLASPQLPPLPESMADVLKKTDADLASKLSLSPELIAFYRQREQPFLTIRSVRDKIIHRGEALDPWIFTFPDGFAVDVNRGFINSLVVLQLWRSVNLKPNNLGSLLAVFAFIAADIEEALTRAAQVLRTLKEVPPAITDEAVFVRSPLNRHAVAVKSYLEQPWTNPADVLPAPRETAT